MHEDLYRDERPRNDRSTDSYHATGDPRQVAVKASGHPLERVTHCTYLPHDEAKPDRDTPFAEFIIGDTAPSLKRQGNEPRSEFDGWSQRMAICSSGDSG